MVNLIAKVWFCSLEEGHRARKIEILKILLGL